MDKPVENAPTGQQTPVNLDLSVDKVPEYEANILLCLKGTAYNAEHMDRKWLAVVREILRQFGPTGYEVKVEPEWMEKD